MWGISRLMKKKPGGHLQNEGERMKNDFITFSLDSISKTIKKPDVVIVYLNNGECWVCDTSAPIRKGNSITYKLATR